MVRCATLPLHSPLHWPLRTSWFSFAGPTPIGAQKANLSEPFQAVMEEVALSEQVSLSFPPVQSTCSKQILSYHASISTLGCLHVLDQPCFAAGCCGCSWWEFKHEAEVLHDAALVLARPNGKLLLQHTAVTSD